MKRLITLLFVLFATLNIGTAQEVSEQQQTLLTKITATWCPNCGSWGWTFFEDLIEDNSTKALLYTCHYSGDLMNSTAQDFATNFDINYQPKFLVGNVNQEVTSSNGPSKRISIKDQVDANWATAPVVNAGMNVSLDGNTITVETKTRFFQATSGEYYLGVYVIEDGVVNFQSGQGNNAVHKNVLRGSMSSSSFGELVSSGDVVAGTDFDNQYSIELDPSWELSNLKIATIVWEKVDDVYVFQNTHYTSEISVTSTEDPGQQDFAMKVYPSLISESATLELNIVNNQSQTEISLVDLNGKTLNRIYSGELSSGIQTFEINRSTVNSGGLYFVVLKSAGQVITEKIIFR